MATHIPGQRCPYCNSLNDGATGVSDDESKPDTGDFSICVYCAEISRYTVTGELAKLTETDLDSLADDEALTGELGKIQASIRDIIKQGKSIQ
jgi:hypothetical protein